MIDFIDHSDEDTLFSIVDRYVPAFMSVLMTMALNKWQISTYEKSGLITTIMDVRKKVDRTKVSGIVVPTVFRNTWVYRRCERAGDR
jgi:hypothetical protein